MSHSATKEKHVASRSRTFFLMLGMLVLLMVIGHLFAGQSGAIIFLGIGLVINIVGYWYSDKMVLKMYRARQIGPGDHSGLYELVRNLAGRMQLPVPGVYIVEDPVPNAFATGRNPEHAAVAATSGLLQALTQEEIEAVMAHELAHVKNYDTLIQTIAAAIASAIMMIASFARFDVLFGFSRDDDDESSGILGLLFAIFIGPVAAVLIRSAVSRSREYLADETAARALHTGRPLASALNRIEGIANRQAMHATPATAHMFIINPLSGGDVMGLFSTHPPTAERVDRLLQMSPN
jgi:heat shock protein HtpX